jgi:hypothetical protein
LYKRGGEIKQQLSISMDYTFHLMRRDKKALVRVLLE